MFIRLLSVFCVCFICYVFSDWMIQGMLYYILGIMAYFFLMYRDLQFRIKTGDVMPRKSNSVILGPKFDYIIFTDAYKQAMKAKEMESTK